MVSIVIKKCVQQNISAWAKMVVYKFLWICILHSFATAQTALNNKDSQAKDQSLIPNVTDIPSTFTFRASCIKKTYVDGFYKRQLNEPALKRNEDGIYTLYATCLNGLGVPTDTKLKLKLIIRYIGEVRTISIRSIVDSSKRYRNCADVSNRNGNLECIPASANK
ncbi:MAG: hypothetical protein C0432_03795 [Candidatus Puniceispirillum sp.]|nr:hypothetical protein [Candidatus Pelagibacter sp.]MBA4283398.1 hypothetical protein [Candidatus Puniceispirillum sp.]